ncbi:FAD-dependent oxidoreductase [Gracilibacillus salinarum]|uniref:FAD-dependent oxidoreductase n=1 Tax=Gracilibacillus salinarum TaxID=2932255 RepID=A0ABY4GLL8_9BACI|nr:FAD-dependent oxidoreductase [Gracilibacillus salinarum]UOQ85256.1 FAD-dependent oxidoreductase [Gracilibacillus salinarum]
MKVLIVGGGIAGLTLAYWLHKNGNSVQIIEKSNELRTEGYMLDFFGPGYDVAERMGIIGQLRQIHYPISGLTFLHKGGKKKFNLPYPSLMKLLDNRHFNFMRGDLEQVLFHLIKGSVTFQFGTSINKVQQDNEKVYVTLSNGRIETADLLVGADGVRSQVRSMVFGEPQSYMKHLGFYTASFILDDTSKFQDLTDAFYSLSAPNLQASVYPIRDDRLAAFFLYRSDKKPNRLSMDDAKQEVKTIFKDMGWIVPELLEKLDASTDFYFDEVSQVEMPQWSKNRIVLVGDACQAVSLVAGQGASLAMTGGYVLADNLQKSNDVRHALTKYEQDLKPQIRKTQEAGRKFANYFLPDTYFSIFIRDMTMRLSVLPVIRKLVNMNSARIPN